MPTPLVSTTIASPLGPLTAVADDRALRLLEYAGEARAERQLARFVARLGVTPIAGRNPVLDAVEVELAAYFAGELTAFATPVTPAGTPFQERVWGELLRIPAGETRSYAQLARAVGDPAATRAVGAANGANPISILVPCHRVVRTGGALGGYGGGIERKRWLLEHERAATGAALFA